MTDAVLEKANKKRDALAAEINSLAQKIEDLKRELTSTDEWIAKWHEFAAAIGGVVELAKGPISDNLARMVEESEARKRRTTGNPKKEEVVKAAVEIIWDRCEPISRSELFAELQKRNLIIRGADPEMVLSTMLWRSRDQIVRLRGGGYWLRDQPWKDADYDPAKYNDAEDALFLSEAEVAELANNPDEESETNFIGFKRRI